MSSTVIPIRIDPGHLAFSETLAALLGADQRVAVHTKIKRAHALREALLRGLIEVERRLRISGDTTTTSPKDNPIRHQRARGRDEAVGHISLSVPNWIAARLLNAALELYRRAEVLGADSRAKITRCWVIRVAMYLGLKDLGREYGARSYLARPLELRQLKEILGGDLAGGLAREREALRARLQELDRELEGAGANPRGRGLGRGLGRKGRPLSAPWGSRLLR